MLVSLTVGKVDAGVAVLLTEDKRLIEFPSVLLPPDISSGSIVDVTVARNHASESRAAAKFAALQDSIYRTFGRSSPSTPVVRCRNATQTSVVLEWDAIELATAELRSLSLYRNGQKAGNIPRPRDMMSTKISGLAVDTEYTFHLVLKTSAGTFTSDKLTVRTHKMTDLTGITVTAGIMPQSLRDSLKETMARVGGRLIDGVRIDTTHFVTTEGRGRDWEKATEMNVPVVVPDWIKGCEREGRIVGVRGYYLNADPRLRQIGQSTAQQSQKSVQSGQQEEQRPRTPLQSPTTHVIPPTPEQATAAEAAAAMAGMDLGASRAPAASAASRSRSSSKSLPKTTEVDEEAAPGSATIPEPHGTVGATDSDADGDDEGEAEVPNSDGDGRDRDSDDEFADQRQRAMDAVGKARARAAQAGPGKGKEESADFDEVQL